MADKKKTETKSKTKSETKSDKSDKSADAGSKSDEKSGGAPKDYSRGENQKPVTKAYRSNWDSIFGVKKRSRA